MKWHIVPAALVALATAVLLLLAPERLAPGLVAPPLDAAPLKP